jgi:hypothetical protein
MNIGSRIIGDRANQITLVMAIAFFSWHVSAYSETPATTKVECEKIIKQLKEIEGTTREMLALVGKQRAKAERDSAWWGSDEFGPYLDSLRAQESRLNAELDQISNMKCP